MGGDLHPVFAFSVFVFDTESGELLREGARIRIGKQTADLLTVLLMNAGRLVSRDQIRDVLWPGGEQVDYEKIINNCIGRLRYVFRDDPKNPQFIERIPKRGYRFLANVAKIDRPGSSAGDGIQAPATYDFDEDEGSGRFLESILSSVDLAQGATALPGIDGSSKDTTPLPVVSKVGGRVRWSQVLTVSFLLATSIAATWFWSRRSGATDAQRLDVLSLGIAPFETEGAGAEELAESFRLDLTDAMAQLPQVRVVAAHSFDARKSSDPDVREKARSLGLNAILFGRFVRDKDNCHLEFELVQGGDATHMASFQYDGTKSQLALIRDRIQEDIFKRLKLSGNELTLSRGSTANSDAYSNYLNARFHFSQQTKESLNLAVKEYDAAISEDANFAKAYAGLGWTWFILGKHNLLPRDNSFQKASDAISTALRLDPSSPEAHGVLGLIEFYRDWNLPAGEREVRQAIELDPNKAIYHQWLAVLLCDQGRCNEALKEVDSAHSADPDWAPVYRTDVFVSGNAQNYPRLFSALRRLSELTQNSVETQDTAANALWYSGRNLEAIAAWRAMAASEGDAARVQIEDRGLEAYLQSGIRGYAMVRLQAIADKKGTEKHPYDFDAVEWYCASGQEGKAIADLQKLAAQKDPEFLEIVLSPVITGLHKEPGFRALLTQVGLSVPTSPLDKVQLGP